MNDTIQFQSRNKRVHYFTLTGLDNLKLALDGLDDIPEDEIIFIETLACPGGCVHGPCTEHDSPGLLERLRVLGKTRYPAAPKRRETARRDRGGHSRKMRFRPPRRAPPTCRPRSAASARPPPRTN